MSKGKVRREVERELRKGAKEVRAWLVLEWRPGRPCFSASLRKEEGGDLSVFRFWSEVQWVCRD